MSDKIEVEEIEPVVKVAVIRGEGVRDCPFGLEIPLGCSNVGEAIHRMAPTDGKEAIGKANRLVYAYHKSCKECPFAAKIIEGGKVDCNFGDTAAGKKTPAFTGSPLYPNTFSGVGLDSLYGFPLSLYSDNNEARNMFFGLFSFLGFAAPEELIKLADKYDKCNEKDKAEIVDGLLNKMKQLKDEYGETFVKMQKILEQYRSQYDERSLDTGLIWHLYENWFGSRQVCR